MNVHWINEKLAETPPCHWWCVFQASVLPSLLPLPKIFVPSIWVESSVVDVLFLGHFWFNGHHSHTHSDSVMVYGKKGLDIYGIVRQRCSRNPAGSGDDQHWIIFWALTMCEALCIPFNQGQEGGTVMALILETGHFRLRWVCIRRITWRTAPPQFLRQPFRMAPESTFVTSFQAMLSLSRDPTWGTTNLEQQPLRNKMQATYVILNLLVATRKKIKRNRWNSF